MSAHGYTYLEIAQRMYSLADENPANVNTSNGYFQSFDTAFAIETAESVLFKKFKRYCTGGTFQQSKAGIIYPAGADLVPFDQLLQTPVTRLISASVLSGTTYIPLRKVDAHREYDYATPIPSTDAYAFAYLWVGDSFKLLPTPSADATCRFVFIPAPKRLMVAQAVGATTPAAGGFASANEYPILPPHMHYLMSLYGALLLEAKRRSKRVEILATMYQDALQDCLHDLERDMTEPDVGVDLTHDSQYNNDSDFAGSRLV